MKKLFLLLVLSILTFGLTNAQTVEAKTFVKVDTTKMLLFRYKDTTTATKDSVFAYKVVKHSIGALTKVNYYEFVTYLNKNQISFNPFTIWYLHTQTGSLLERNYNWR